MRAYDELVEHIERLMIVDTHEHLPNERDMPRQGDVLSEWLRHYFSCDLVSAGLDPADLERARDPKGDLGKRWKLIEPFWHAAESTGYGRALAISARDLFGIERIDSASIGLLDARVREGRSASGYYARVLQEKSRIALSIRDTMPFEDRETPDRFVFTMRTDPFIVPSHIRELRVMGERVGMSVHTLDDWKEVTRAVMDRHFTPGSRTVCLKCGLAYQRTLRFEKATEAEAERDFRALFDDRNLPEWRAGIKPGQALQDYMQHWICRLAEERGLAYQIHTGIQEGNGNVLSDSNPLLLTNLFLEYSGVRFDVFHMGYPFVAEAGTLAKNLRNVYLDMCWGHIISPEMARRALIEWLDAVPANKINAFGGDYCFVEGVYGHQALARRNVAASLAAKIADGSMDLERAREVATWVFVDNPVRIFGLEKHMRASKRSGPGGARK